MLGKKRGFTMIEVALFLAITGALFAGVTVGVQNSIFQQRYNDSVQNFAEFLRTSYAESMNVQGVGNGRSDTIIYGKLIVFSTNDNGNGNRNDIIKYDLVGNEGDISSGEGLLKALEELNVGVVHDDKVGMMDTYTPRWSSSIEKACNGSECEYTPFVGAVLIVRHPRSGATFTYITDVNIISYVNANINVGSSISWDGVELGFKKEEVNFCINPTAGEARSNRRDVKIVRGARNGSGVEIVADEGKNNKCVKQE